MQKSYVMFFVFFISPHNTIYLLLKVTSWIDSLALVSASLSDSHDPQLTSCQLWSATASECSSSQCKSPPSCEDSEYWLCFTELSCLVLKRLKELQLGFRCVSGLKVVSSVSGWTFIHDFYLILDIFSFQTLLEKHNLKKIKHLRTSALQLRIMKRVQFPAGGVIYESKRLRKHVLILFFWFSCEGFICSWGFKAAEAEITFTVYLSIIFMGSVLSPLRT